MAPIQTKQMPDLSDDLRRDLESIATPDIEAAFQELDKTGSVEASSSSYMHRGVIDQATANGVPVSPRELFGSDQVYNDMVEVAREQVAATVDQDRHLGEQQPATIRSIGNRLDALRGRFISN